MNRRSFLSFLAVAPIALKEQASEYIDQEFMQNLDLPLPENMEKFSEIVAKTVRLMAPKIQENIKANNALLAKLANKHA